MEIERLYKDNFLIVHQTYNKSAEKINLDPYFSYSGLEGTALMASVEDVMNTIPELDKPPSERKFVTHKGADSLVIMTFPRTLISGPKVSVRDMDDLLVDLARDGKLNQFGLPNSNILGYYYNGQFHKNEKFNPVAILNL